jgi:hypothetical protein
MEVRFFKLITGEEVLAKAKYDVNMWHLKNPVKLAFTQQGVAMMPYAPLLKVEEVTIRIEHVLFHGEVAEEVFNAYNSKFGSGIVLAGPSGLRIAGEND